VRPTSRIEPRPEHHAFYQGMVDLYIPLFEAMRSTFTGLAAIPAAPA
jgi:hypothetical protein